MNRLRTALLLLSTLAPITTHAESDINKVQTDYEQITAREPRNADALFTLALVYEKKGMRQDAIAAWKRYLTVETDPGKRSLAQKHIHRLSQ